MVKKLEKINCFLNNLTDYQKASLLVALSIISTILYGFYMATRILIKADITSLNWAVILFCGLLTSYYLVIYTNIEYSNVKEIKSKKKNIKKIKKKVKKKKLIKRSTKETHHYKNFFILR